MPIISDNGTGISPDDMPNIFNSFYKGSNNYKSGLGLGLFLSKAIIDSHHGNIAISSKEKGGTAVTINLPHVS